MQHTFQKQKKVSLKRLFSIAGLTFLFSVVCGEIMHVSISAQTCMTTAQVQSDTRCLYIVSKQVYQIGTRQSPHHGQQCGTDVTNVLPSSHKNTPANYLTPNFIATICTTTPTNTPTSTTTPTSKPTATPTVTIVATSTPTPTLSNGITFTFPAFLHGIGNGGDNVSPNSAGILTPNNPQRSFTMSLLDAANNPVITQQGTMNYISASGNFYGSITFPSTIANQTYTVALSTQSFLQKKFAGFQQVPASGTISLPAIYLTAGDINNDNQIDVSDYNLLISCYGSKQHTATCTTAQASDLNNDGVVDGKDYNLFLRELSVQKGGQ